MSLLTGRALFSLAARRCSNAKSAKTETGEHRRKVKEAFRVARYREAKKESGEEKRKILSKKIPNIWVIRIIKPLTETPQTKPV